MTTTINHSQFQLLTTPRPRHRWLNVGLQIGVSCLALILAGCNGLLPMHTDMRMAGPESIADHAPLESPYLPDLLDPLDNAGRGRFAGTVTEAIEKQRLLRAYEEFYKYSADPAELRVRRNRVQEALLGASEQLFGRYEQHLRDQESQVSFMFGTATTLLAAVAAATPVASSGKWWAAAAGATSGIRAEWDQSYLSNLAVRVITEGIRARRREIYAEILQRQSESVATYSAEAAVRDALRYHAACNVVVGMEYASKAIAEANNPGLANITDALLKNPILGSRFPELRAPRISQNIDAAAEEARAARDSYVPIDRSIRDVRTSLAELNEHINSINQVTDSVQYFRSQKSNVAELRQKTSGATNLVSTAADALQQEIAKRHAELEAIYNREPDVDSMVREMQANAAMLVGSDPSSRAASEHDTYTKLANVLARVVELRARATAIGKLQSDWSNAVANLRSSTFSELESLINELSNLVSSFTASDDKATLEAVQSVGLHCRAIRNVMVDLKLR